MQKRERKSLSKRNEYPRSQTQTINTSIPIIMNSDQLRDQTVRIERLNKASKEDVIIAFKCFAVIIILFIISNLF